MRAILVDPFKREVREINDDFNKLSVLQSYLANGNADGDKTCYICSGPRLVSDVHTYVDDEGLFRPDQAFFALPGYPHPLAGYMLCLASTEDGDEASLPAKYKPELLARAVTWIGEAAAKVMVQPTTIQPLGPDLQPSGPVEVLSRPQIDGSLPLADKKPSNQ